MSDEIYGSQDGMAVDTPRKSPVVDNKEWSLGLFGCFADVTTCVKALFCPCIVYAQNKQVLNRTGSIGPDALLYCCGIDFWCCGSTGAIGGSNRSEIRQSRNIQGSFATDFITHCFCAPCALTQEKLELELLKEE
ncbi:hypothetical protein HDV01_003533 [Terramyces sp. JEL0728]|nr:hypothetical protein HDV01_003533 [Terramyces sp. JEL0728]